MITDIQLWYHKRDAIFSTGFMEKKYFVFLVFKENLFEVNHRLILTTSPLIVENNFFMFEWV